MIETGERISFYAVILCGAVLGTAAAQPSALQSVFVNPAQPETGIDAAIVIALGAFRPSSATRDARRTPGRATMARCSRSGSSGGTRHCCRR